MKKLVRTRYFCRVNLPYHAFMKWIRTYLFLVAYGPKTEKKEFEFEFEPLLLSESAL